MEQIERSGIVPVIVLNEAKNAVPLAKALLAGGIGVMEITFRTAAAAESIERVTAELPEMLVGAGTVLTTEQLHSAKKAGARFIVSPGLSTTVVKAAQAEGLDIFPGVVTPSELCAGIELGLSVFKFFPAESYGGIKTVKALAAPFGGVKFLPTGGISEKNAADYWSYNRVLAVGGSWMAPEKLIDSGDFAEIERRSKAAVELAKSCGR